jgi:mono/diheme cytochrome c family protein
MLRISSKIKNRFYYILTFLLAGIFLTIHFHQAVEAHGPMGWKAPAKERKVKNPIPSSSESRSRAQKIYVDKCASCHGVRGDGNGEMAKALDPHPSNFTDRHMMKEMTDGEIFWKITTGKGPMPSYQKELTENERWDLVNYIRSFAKPK